MDKQEAPSRLGQLAEGTNEAVSTIAHASLEHLGEVTSSLTIRIEELLAHLDTEAQPSLQEVGMDM